jgi:DNA-binding MarR family transcriptional regulator
MMKLEQAIQQAEFSSDNQRITLNFMYTYNWFKEAQKNFFKPYDITSQQFNVLRILRGNYPNPYTTSQVRDRMLDKMSDASRIVDRLVKKGLVIRTVTKTDKRLVDVVISRKGIEILDRIDAPLEDFMAEAFNNLTINEKNLFVDMLEKIREN